VGRGGGWKGNDKTVYYTYSNFPGAPSRLRLSLRLVIQKERLIQVNVRFILSKINYCP